MGASAQERIDEYEREILRSLAGMEREENRGQEAPKLSNKNKGRKIQSQGEEPMRDHWRSRMHTLSWIRRPLRLLTGSAVPDQRSGLGGDRRDRRRNDSGRHERVRSRPEPVPNGGPIRVSPYLGPEPARERGQAGQEEKTRQRQHPGGRRIAHGGTVAAPQRNRAGSLLSPDRAAYWRRCRRLRHGKKIGHSDLPAVAVGTTLCRPRRPSLRKAVSGAPHWQPEGHR